MTGFAGFEVSNFRGVKLPDEIHQVFVPGRFGQIRDVIIDSMGVAMGIVILHIIMKASDRRKAQKNETEIV